MTLIDSPTPSKPRVLWFLLGIVLLSASLRFWMMTNTVVPSRDCLVFVRIAMQLNDPPKSQKDPARQLDGMGDVLRETDQAPGYSFAILGLAKIKGVDFSNVDANEMVRIAQLISLISGVLSIFPMFAVASRLFGSTVALLACGWYQILPVCVEVTSDGLSDGLFLLTAITAIWFGQRSLDCSVWYLGLFNGLLAGVCIGGGYLVRPDSLIVGGGMGMLFLGTFIARVIRKQSSAPLFLAGIGLIVGTSVLMAPYVKTIGRLTNKPTGQGIIDGSGDEKKTYFERTSSLPNVRLPFAAWWDAKDGDSNRMIWGSKALFAEFSKGGHYLLPFVALIGILISRRKWFDAHTLLLLILLSMHMGVLWYMAGKIGYVSQRHTLLSVMISAIFAASAIPILIEWGKTKINRGAFGLWLIFWCLLIAGSCLPRDFQRLHADRAGHREAGEWIRREGNIQFPVVDPFGWVEFYSGRTVRGWSTANPFKPPFVYAIVEPNAKSHHSRLPWLEDANKLAEGGELVFQYPANATPEKVKIAVYKCPPLKQVK